MLKIAYAKHKAYYDDPLALQTGEKFAFSGRGDAWENNPNHIWLWAIAQDGREGWVPEGFAVVENGKAVAPREYSARELNVAAGERLEIVRETNGWAWCENNSGETGWVPLKTFDPTDQ